MLICEMKSYDQSSLSEYNWFVGSRAFFPNSERALIAKRLRQLAQLFALRLLAMSQWQQPQPGFQYPLQTGYSGPSPGPPLQQNPQFQQNSQFQPQNPQLYQQQQGIQPPTILVQPTGFVGQRPLQTGFQQPQPTGFMGQVPLQTVPPLPLQASQPTNFVGQRPLQAGFQQPQPTGFVAQRPLQTGFQQPQPTSFSSLYTPGSLPQLPSQQFPWGGLQQSFQQQSNE